MRPVTAVVAKKPQEQRVNGFTKLLIKILRTVIQLGMKDPGTFPGRINNLVNFPSIVAGNKSKRFFQLYQVKIRLVELPPECVTGQQQPDIVRVI